MARFKCSAPGCWNTSEDKSKSFFAFPREPARCHKWLRFCGLEDRYGSFADIKTNMKICYDNFNVIKEHMPGKLKMHQAAPAEDLETDDKLTPESSMPLDNSMHRRPPLNEEGVSAVQFLEDTVPSGGKHLHLDVFAKDIVQHIDGLQCQLCYCIAQMYHSFKRKMQIELEEDKTTYKHDYKSPRKLKQDTRWKRASYSEFEKPKGKTVYFEDHESFQRTPSDQYIQFDLLWKRKPIIQTDPRQITITKPLSNDTFDRRTRPRVIMSPAISLDEARDTLADEPENQNLLTQYTYTTTWKKASQEAALPVTEKEIPNSTLEMNADPARFICEDTNSIPLGWKQLAFDWDKVQNRMVSDPTRAFWEQTAMRVKCGACETNIKGRNFVDAETKRRIETLVKTNNLHPSRDIPIPGYSGYIPKLPVGSPLEKRHLESTNPRLSTSQALSKWREIVED